MSTNRSNEEWLQELSSSGERQSAAIEALGRVLLRAARYTFERHLGGQAQFSQLEIESLAEECAQESLVSVLNHLPEFRGESQFLTWAYKFAINISLTTARREQWKGQSLDDLDEFPAHSQGPLDEDRQTAEPERAVLRRELWQILSDTIRSELTEKQQLVLKWMVFEEVPMDVVVQHLSSNRNAIYKLLHDGRKKLKQALLVRGIGVGEAIDLFGPKR